jgi:hypothetical protein
MPTHGHVGQDAPYASRSKAGWIPAFPSLKQTSSAFGSPRMYMTACRRPIRSPSPLGPCSAATGRARPRKVRTHKGRVTLAAGVGFPRGRQTTQLTAEGRPISALTERPVSRQDRLRPGATRSTRSVGLSAVGPGGAALAGVGAHVRQQRGGCPDEPGERRDRHDACRPTSTWSTTALSSIPRDARTRRRRDEQLQRAVGDEPTTPRRARTAAPRGPAAGREGGLVGPAHRGRWHRRS